MSNAYITAFNSPTFTDMTPCFSNVSGAESISFFLLATPSLFSVCHILSFALRLKQSYQALGRQSPATHCSPPKESNNFLVLECSFHCISDGCFLLCPWDISPKRTGAALSTLWSPISPQHRASDPSLSDPGSLEDLCLVTFLTPAVLPLGFGADFCPHIPPSYVALSPFLKLPDFCLCLFSLKTSYLVLLISGFTEPQISRIVVKAQEDILDGIFVPCVLCILHAFSQCFAS